MHVGCGVPCDILRSSDSVTDFLAWIPPVDGIAATHFHNYHSPNQTLALCELDRPEEILANRAFFPQLALSGDPFCKKPRRSIQDDGCLEL